MPPQLLLGMLGPGGGLGRALAVQHLAEVPQVCGSVPPIDNLGPFATEARRHFVPDPLRSIPNDHYRAQNGRLTTAVRSASAPPDHLQCSTLPASAPRRRTTGAAFSPAAPSLRATRCASG